MNLLARYIGPLPPILIIAESRPTVGKTTHKMGVVDQARAEEIEAMLQIVGVGNEIQKEVTDLRGDSVGVNDKYGVRHRK